MLQLTYENIFQVLIMEIPEFTEELKVAEKEFGPDLGYLIFGSFTYFFIKVVQSIRVKNSNIEINLAKRIGIFIEKMIQSEDRKIQDLVSCSFLENLWLAKKDYQYAKKFLLPKTLEWLKAYE